MAIVTETFNIGEQQFTRTYSDLGMKVHGGVPEDDYDEVCDPTEYGRTYTETDIPIESDGDELADKARAYDILIGGAT